MGYTKVVQYGDVTEIFLYEKAYIQPKPIHLSALQKKRNRKRLSDAKKKGVFIRTRRSILRSQKAFYRFCHANVCEAETVTFVTLTFAHDLTYKEATRHLARFMERIKTHYNTLSLSYISVPELTQKGRYHFHLLVFNLPSEAASRERETRNFQRQFRRGYVDLMLAKTTTTGIAGYMAKYMGKALGDARNEAVRGYNCSHNIIKVRSHGSNSFDRDLDLMQADTIDEVKTSEYSTPYMGTCTHKKIINTNYNEYKTSRKD